MPRKKAVDAKDIEILNILQKDARISNKDLASKIGLSESPTFTRVEMLNIRKVIMGSSVILNFPKFGYKFLTLVEFSTNASDEANFEQRLQDLPSVLTVYLFSRNEGIMSSQKVSYFHATFAHKSKVAFLDEMKGFLSSLGYPVDYRVYELKKVVKAFPTMRLSSDDET